ncbi:MFS transporter [Aquimarina addita]|uniref:MFS transporter n=1 Tax=Aquimarina addita TaxID=870485 RepID=A0ABP6UMC7_9FLAO
MKKYFIYLLLLTFSMLGTDLTDFSLAIWVLDQPNSNISSYSLIWFFEAIPKVILALVIGSLVDRWNKKKMIIYGQLLAGIGSIILMVLKLQDILLPWHIMAVAGIGSVANMFVYSAFFVSTRALVSKDNLMKAMGLSTLMYSIVEIGVPVAAPVFYKAIGIHSILFFDIITFIVSIIFFSFLNFTVHIKSNDKFSIVKDLKLTIAFIREKKGLISLIIFSFLGSFALGLVEILFTPLILDFSDEYILGLILSFIGLGSFIGSIIMSNSKGFKKPIKSIVSLNIIIGLILIILMFKFNLYILAIGGFVVVLCFTIEGISNSAFYQTIIPEDMLGRIYGIMGLLIGIAGPMSFLLSGIMVDSLSTFFNSSMTFKSNLPGTNTTISILVIFLFSGIFLASIALIFRRSTAVQKLDKLYKINLDTN